MSLLGVHSTSWKSSTWWTFRLYFVYVFIADWNFLTIFCSSDAQWGLFFTKDASLEFIPAISLKRDSNAEAFPHGFFTVTLFKVSENFLRDIFAKHFLTKSQVSNLQVANLMEIMCFTKLYRTSF